MHPSVSGREEQLRQRRFIGVMFAGSFLAACAAAPLLAFPFGVMTAAATVCLVLVIGWLIALLVAATGRDSFAGPLALAVATVIVAALIATAGGVGSPAALCVAALVVEPYWVTRSRRSLITGAAAVVAALASQACLGSLLPYAPVGAGWHWLMVLAYSATVFVRHGAFIEFEQGRQPRPTETEIEDVIDAVVLRIGSGSDVAAVSRKAEPIFGLQPELLLGSGFFERIHVADRVGYLCALSDLRAGGTPARLALRIRLPHETIDNFRSFSAELATVGAEARTIVVILRKDEEMVELRRQLAEAIDRADSIDVTRDRFLAAVSHELRTPLNAIIGFSDMMLHEMFGGFKDPRQKEYVGLIRDSGHHLLSVVNSILDVSKIASGAFVTYPERFRFRDAVESCIAMLGLQAKTKNLVLSDEVAHETGQLVADRRAVQQMLINLVSNAVKFTPEGGKVTIGGKRIGSRLHFWVEDNGIGIAEADLDRLGRPFVQLDNDYTRRYEGTGLGLSLVKGMVALHEGTMSIESAPGEGTIVSISLPVEGIVTPDAKGEVLSLAAAKVRENAHDPLRKTA